MFILEMKKKRRSTFVPKKTCKNLEDLSWKFLKLAKTK